MNGVSRIFSISMISLAFFLGCSSGPSDKTPPQVKSATPADHATGVCATPTLVVGFSKDMDNSSINASTFKLAESGSPVAGKLTGSGRMASFAPQAALIDGTAYTATVTTGVKDTLGNHLAADFTWSFTTGQTGVAGKIVDLTGAGIAGVQIAGCGANATSAADGSYQLSAAPGADQIVVFSRAGYITSSWRVTVIQGASSTLPITMMPEAAPKQLDSTAGGKVTGSRGASLNAPAGAFVDAQSNPVTGTVDVSLTPYDPAVAEQANAYPGELRGSTLSGDTVPLITLGVLDVKVSQGGQPLNVAPGMTVDLGIPAPSAGDKPATTKLWYYDEAQAVWVQVDGDASYDSGTDSYSASVSHLTSYNADHPMDPSCAYGTVENQDGNPIVMASVSARQGYKTDPHFNRGIYSWTLTDSDGNFCMTVERGEKVLIEVTTLDGKVTQRTITANSTRSKTYPADCSTGTCKRIPTIVLGTNDPGEQDNQASCQIDHMSVDPGKNPFTSTCAYDLADFYSCFAPQGKCTYDLNMDFLTGAASETIAFANGSKMETTAANPYGGGGGMKVYGPDPFNTYCGEITSDGGKTTITTAAGNSYGISTTESGATVIECPSGFSFTLSGDQQDAMAACSGQPSDSGGGGVGCDPAPGSFNGTCTFASDCLHSYDCCGKPTGEHRCFPTDFCSAYEQSCSSDYECGGIDYGPGTIPVCCSMGFFDMCMPSSSCQ